MKKDHCVGADEHLLQSLYAIKSVLVLDSEGTRVIFVFVGFGKGSMFLLLRMLYINVIELRH